MSVQNISDRDHSHAQHHDQHHDRDPRLAIAILAAGASRRLGQPKQLLRYDGETLLQRAVDAARGAGAARMLLMLGANAQACWDALRDRSDLERIDVPDVDEGMAASLRAAVMRVEHEHAIERLLVMLVDQPAVDAAWLRQLRELGLAYPQRMIASVHTGVRAAPAIFPRIEFQALLRLRGDAGARGLLRARGDTVEFPAPHPPGDIDTPQDVPNI
jgi:molybdenum cofactor cytidylyltransferase